MVYDLSSLWYRKNREVYAMSQGFRLKQAIEDAVIAGDFLPGDRLDEASLAERFGVSRTPIREALLQLGAEGFIDVRPRRGAIVRAHADAPVRNVRDHGGDRKRLRTIGRAPSHARSRGRHRSRASRLRDPGERRRQ